MLVSHDYTVHVSDFGFARLKQQSYSYAHTKTVLGPVRYMSPESISEKVCFQGFIIKACHSLSVQKYSEKSDAYSFGVFLWEVLSREAPYAEEENLIKLAYNVAFNGSLFLRQILFLGTNTYTNCTGLRLQVSKEWPSILSNLILSCFKADPKERPCFDAILGILNDYYESFS